MKEQAYGQTVGRKKAVAVGMLFVVSAVITLLGVSFGVYSAINHVEFMVLQNKVPGAIFGVIVTFLGVRYFLAVMKLKAEIDKTASRFSWSNFKKK